MFCPRCGAEYRAGFRRCSDCGRDLVEALPAKKESLKNNLANQGLENSKRVWSGQHEERCLVLCQRLRTVGIPFRVDQRRHQYLLRVVEHYAIGVPTEFFEVAKKLIIKGHV